MTARVSDLEMFLRDGTFCSREDDGTKMAGADGADSSFMGTATYTTFWWGSTELVIVVVVVVMRICNCYLSYALISIVVVEFAIRSLSGTGEERERRELEERREKVVLGA